MGQEFIIKSQQIEDKINQLLPSQGGFQAGVDFSASTTVIPIVDLTETAEGSPLRQDLQTALGLSSVTAFSVVNTTSTLINTTGYFKVFGTYSSQQRNPGGSITFKLTDGISSKDIYTITMKSISTDITYVGNYEFTVFLEAGESLTCTSSNTTDIAKGVTRQIADLQGNLIDP